MSKNILLIVEGSVYEQNIFGDVFSKYGFNTIVSNQKMDVDGVGQCEKFEYQLEKNKASFANG